MSKAWERERRRRGRATAKTVWGLFRVVVQLTLGLVLLGVWVIVQGLRLLALVVGVVWRVVVWFCCPGRS